MTLTLVKKTKTNSTNNFKVNYVTTVTETRMKNTLLSTIIASLMIFASNVNANINADAANDFVQNITKEGIEEIINANAPQAQKDAKFKTLFNNALDLNFIGRFVLGRSWRTATPVQRDAFIKAYSEFNTKSWSGKFDAFKGKSFNFTGTTPANNKTQIFINSSVTMDQGEPAKVIWRVQEKNGNYKIIDIIVENVSLAITARNEYSSFIKNNPGGVDALIKNLQDKIK